ncbi:unnamed protein product [Pleuronectes platessa]|uniref:Uncharacterized protein n=1 Tax=Pleuronectes platessa TaxID=8262 RepID=A0A9N7YGT9_PLEPL|nr:unnamed protein product [Pleuronectes platessa]
MTFEIEKLVFNQPGGLVLRGADELCLPTSHHPVWETLGKPNVVLHKQQFKYNECWSGNLQPEDLKPEAMMMNCITAGQLMMSSEMFRWNQSNQRQQEVKTRKRETRRSLSVLTSLLSSRDSWTFTLSAGQRRGGSEGTGSLLKRI